MQLNAPSSFPTESLVKLYQFVQSTFSGEKAFRAEDRRTLWSPIANVEVAIVDTCNISEGIAWYPSTISLL